MRQWTKEYNIALLFSIYDTPRLTSRRFKEMLLIEKYKSKTWNTPKAVSALFEIDSLMLCNIWCDDRGSKRIQVIQFVEYFKIDRNEFLTLWLVNKILDALKDEDELRDSSFLIILKRLK